MGLQLQKTDGQLEEEARQTKFGISLGLALNRYLEAEKEREEATRALSGTLEETRKHDKNPSLRQRVLEGESTGNPVKDFLLVQHGFFTAGQYDSLKDFVEDVICSKNLPILLSVNTRRPSTQQVQLVFGMLSATPEVTFYRKTQGLRIPFTGYVASEDGMKHWGAPQPGSYTLREHLDGYLIGDDDIGKHIGLMYDEGKRLIESAGHG